MTPAVTAKLEYYFSYQGAEVYRTSDFESLPDETKGVLSTQLTKAAAIGFRRPLTPEYAETVLEHMRGGDLYIVVQQGVALGFANRRFYPELEAVYLVGAVKSPEAPSAIMEEITRRYLEEKGAKVVVTRTQNDRVVEIVANLCREVVALDRPAEQAELDLLAIMDVLPKDKEFDPVSLVIRKSYGTRLIQDGPRRRSSVAKVVALTELLDYEEGDAVMLVGYR